MARVSPRASRFFGCILPLALVLFGCGSCALLGYAGQVFIALLEVPDGALAPLLRAGERVLSDNTAYWEDPPGRNTLASLESPDGLVVRYVIAQPGDRVAASGGRVTVNGQPCDGRSRDTRGLVCSLEAIWQGEPVADFAELELPDDHFWVMAARADAADSRLWGPMPREAFYGSVLLRTGQGLRLEAIDLPEAPATPPAAPAP